MNFLEDPKVSSIAEICQVSVDEAASALLACRMDETLAIERLLSGELRTSAWSEVSKKRKQTSFRPRMRGDRKANPGHVKSKHEAETSRMKRGALNNNSGTVHRRNRIPSSNSNSTPVLSTRSETSPKVLDVGSSFHGAEHGHRDAVSEPISDKSEWLKTSSTISQSLISSSVSKRSTVKYSSVPATCQDKRKLDIDDNQKDREKSSANYNVNSSAAQGNWMSSMSRAAQGNEEDVDDNRVRSNLDTSEFKPSWSTDMCGGSEERLNSAGSEALLTSCPSNIKNIDSDEGQFDFVIQFGSFGLGSMKSVDWRSTDCMDTHNYVDNENAVEPDEDVSRIGTDDDSSPAISFKADAVHSSESLQKSYSSRSESVSGIDDPRKTGHIESSGAPTTIPITSKVPVSNCASYSLPAVPELSSASAFDDTSQISLARANVSAFSPLTACEPSVSVGLKHEYSGLVNSSSSLPPELSAKFSPPNSTTEADKTNVMSNGPTLPASLDPVSAPYMIPGYPILMPSYPSMQYAPPGITHHGGGHFTYATVGQLSNPTPYNPYHTQSSVNKIIPNGDDTRSLAVEEGAANVARNITGTAEASAFGAGSYVTASDGSHLKNSVDPSTFKTVPRAGAPASGFGSVLHNVMTGTHIGNMPYEYSVQAPNAAQLTVGNLSAANWGSRQLSPGRTDALGTGYPQLNTGPGYYGNGYY